MMDEIKVCGETKVRVQESEERVSENEEMRK